MKESQMKFKTKKEVPQDESSLGISFLIQANFLEKLTSGVYNYLPLGFRVLKKIEKIVREEMEAIGGEEILMASLHPKKNWEATGRWNSFDALFKVHSRFDQWYALGPTHEEIVTPLAQNFIFSYKDLPLYLFQIQTKFRDEPRPKAGLLRTKEFIMKDLYSFHRTEEDLDAYYELVKEAYNRIFQKCGLLALIAEASGGTFSPYSHEFQVETKTGEDLIYHCSRCGFCQNQEIAGDIEECPKCQSPLEKLNCSEVGNIFKLKDKYSSALGLKFIDKDGKEKNVLMGCYGIGISRLVGTIAELNNDKNGMIWPEKTAPFSCHLLGFKTADAKKNALIKKKTDELYQKMIDAGYEVLYDDREEVSSGEKLVDADLLGLPCRIVVSEKTVSQDSFELKERKSGKIELIKIEAWERAFDKTS